MFILTRSVDGKPMLLNLDRVDGLVMEHKQTLAICQMMELPLDNSFWDILKKLGPQVIGDPPPAAEVN